VSASLVDYVEHVSALHHSALIIERNSLTELIRRAKTKDGKRPWQLRRRIVDVLLSRNTRGLR